MAVPERRLTPAGKPRRIGRRRARVLAPAPEPMTVTITTTRPDPDGARWDAVLDLLLTAGREPKRARPE